MENGFIELIHSASSRNARYRCQAAYEVNSERFKYAERNTEVDVKRLSVPRRRTDSETMTLDTAELATRAGRW